MARIRPDLKNPFFRSANNKNNNYPLVGIKISGGEH